MYPRPAKTEASDTTAKTTAKATIVKSLDIELINC